MRIPSQNKTIYDAVKLSKRYGLNYISFMPQNLTQELNANHNARGGKCERTFYEFLFMFIAVISIV